MSNSLNIVREKMDKLLDRLDKSTEQHTQNMLSVIENIKVELGFSDGDLSKPKLWGWIPPSVWCPSELGTTSDQCSSACGVGRCSSRAPGGDNNKPHGEIEQPTQSPIPVLGFAGANPF